MRLALYLTILALGSLYGGINYKNLSPAIRILVVLIMVTLIHESVVKILKPMGYNPALSYHLYIMIQFPVLTWVYYEFCLKRFGWGRIFFVLSIGLFTLFTLINFLWQLAFQFELGLPKNAIILSIPFYVFQSFITYFYILKTTDEKPLHTRSVFWFNTACFIFYSTTFFIFGSDGFLSKRTNRTLYDILYILNIALYTIYGVAIYKEVVANKKNKEICRM